ncbi:RhaT protein [Pasteurellaceae bacterium LFhippo2]|nr:RhaT protein [Pasteurellaceae bacterium LFhippo2]
MFLQHYRGELILLLTTILASAGWFFSKYAIADFPPVGFIAIRFFLAAIIFLPFAYKHLAKLGFTQLKMAGIVGIFFSLNLITWIIAITGNAKLGQGAFIMSLSLLIAPFISWLIFRNKPSHSFWFALPVAISGLYFLVLDGKGISLSMNDGAFLVSSFMAAFYFVLINQYAKQIPALPLTTILFLIVAFVGGCYSLFIEDWQVNIQMDALWWLIASVLIATNLRFLLQTIGQKHCNIVNASFIMLLEPVWTLLLSLWILSESLSIGKGVGCLLILGSLIIYRLPFLLKKWK